ncbi:MAG: molybdate ABC transporter substrate-binding protein [Sneathiella sp.]
MRKVSFFFRLPCLATLLILTYATANAGQVYVAVAANFTPAAKEIATAFDKKTGHRAILSFGSTGKLYTQIINGAPFEIFLSADQKHPKLTIEQGFAIKNTRFTYAAGHLVLYSADEQLIDKSVDILRAATFRKIAIANPKTAPYGRAAQEVMVNLNVLDAVQSQIVRGDNIAQTYQFVATGNAELGFVALSQVIGHKAGSRWIVPTGLYAPLKQDVVLLKTSKNNTVASAFFTFLKSPDAAAIIKKYGYTLGKLK